MKKRIVLLACALISANLGFCFSDNDTPGRRDAKSAVLGPDDSITVLALNCEEISKEWRLGPTGDVTFPLIGRMHLAGLTMEQTEQEIAGKLKKFLKDPQVTVFSTEMRSQPVTITGAVEKPGRYQLAGAPTILDALVLAGGPKNAGTVVTLRRSAEMGRLPGKDIKSDAEGTFSMAEFDMKAVVDGPGSPGPEAGFKLKPFDVITVAPANLPRYVHVFGEVMRPGSVELVTQESVSIMKVLAVAGGLGRTASPGNAVITHISPEGNQTSTATVDLRKILEGKSKDIELIAGDILMIPSSRAKVISEALTGTAMNAGVTSAIYTLARF